MVTDMERIQRLGQLDTEYRQLARKLADLVGIRFVPKGVKRKARDKAETPEPGSAEAPRAVLLRHLSENADEAFTVPTLSRSLGIPLSKVTSELYWLMKNGNIRRVQRGHYQAAQ